MKPVSIRMSQWRPYAEPSRRDVLDGAIAGLIDSLRGAHAGLHRGAAPVVCRQPATRGRSADHRPGCGLPIGQSVAYPKDVPRRSRPAHRRRAGWDAPGVVAGASPSVLWCGCALALGEGARSERRPTNVRFWIFVSIAWVTSLGREPLSGQRPLFKLARFKADRHLPAESGHQVHYSYHHHKAAASRGRGRPGRV